MKGRRPLTRLVAGPAPFVSVVITVYNAERYLPRCLESLLALDYPKDRYEVVIVDARSRDRTQDIVREFAAPSSPSPTGT